MLKALIAIGLMFIGLIAADLLQLNGYGATLGAIYLAVFLPLFIIEIVRLRK